MLIHTRRVTVGFAFVGLATSLAACGSSGSSTNAARSSSTSASPTNSAAAASKVTVGSTSVQKSTLVAGQTSAFMTSKAVKQTRRGLAVSVGPNQQTVAPNADSHGIPQSFEVGITVTPPTSPKLLYGIGCEGDYVDFGDQYAAVTDSTGGWEIVQQKGTSLTTLASGRAQLAGGDTQLNLVCAQVKSPAFTTRLSFAIDNKIVKTIDHTDKHFASSNGFTILVADPGSGSSGTAIFHNLDVRSATAT